MKVVYYNIREKLEKICSSKYKDEIKHIELTEEEYKELINLCTDFVCVTTMGSPQPHSIPSSIDHISFQCEGSTTDVNVNIPYFMDVKLLVEKE